MNQFPTFEIRVNGTPIPDTLEVASINASATGTALPEARLVIADPAEGGTFQPSTLTLFLPGSSVAIAAGYEGQNTPIFEGVIGQQSLRVSATTHFTLTADVTGAPVATLVLDTSQPPALTLTLGIDILEMALKIGPSGLHGSVTACGTALPQPGKMLQLAGIGPHYDGPALINAVRHTIADGDWLTTISVGLPE